MALTLYERCAIESHGDTDTMTKCVADQFDYDHATGERNLTHWLLVILGAFIFFMQAGFAMLCAGCVRKKNVQNTMLKSLLDASGAAVAFYVCGFAFAFSKPSGNRSKSFIGTANFFCMGDMDPAFWFFKYAFSATCVTIVAGTLAERCKMAAYIYYSIFVTAFVYPIAARALWSEFGFLSASSDDPFNKVGVIDFAGSSVVHATGGLIALIAAKILGSRVGRFHDINGVALPEPKEIPGHSISLQVIGAFILAFGWLGFNAGSALLLSVFYKGEIAALAAVNTAISAATGAVSSLFTCLMTDKLKTGKYDLNIQVALNGLLSGCVAITGACGTIEPWAACLIGMISGWVYLLGSSTLVRWKIDDAVDAIPVHLFNGIWGTIATGLFSSPVRTKMAYGQDDHVGFFYMIGKGTFDLTLLVNQLVGLVFLLGWAAITTVPFFWALDYLGWMRANSMEELIGLDTNAVDIDAVRNNLTADGVSGLGHLNQEVDTDNHDRHTPNDEDSKMS